MDRKFIIDKEINLTTGDNDSLKTKVYADNLVDVINNTEDGKVFTIGLFGSWGSGKSSIVKTAQEVLENQKGKTNKFITYDAWQYANDSFRRMFLLKVKEELKFEDEDLLKGFYTHKSQDVEIKYRPSTNRTLITIGAILLAIVIIQFLPIKIEYKVNISSICSIIGLLLGIVLGAFNQLKISETKPLMFAPEQFEDCFKQMIAKSLKKYKWIEKLSYVLTGDKTIKDIDKLVIVIDNIDRCNNDIAYNLLTDIKTFLGSEKYNIVFVIPVDDEALRKHILGNKKTATNTDDCNKDKEEFLRKFFNITIRIKPYFEADMFTFAKAINEKYDLRFKPETLALASKEYSTNPRRIIQLFNNLSAELNLYQHDNGFAEKNETLICGLLILREEFNEKYKEILNNTSILTKKISTDTTEENKETEKNANRFLRIIRNYIPEIEPNIANKILSNSDNLFSMIPTDVKDAIQTNDIEKVLDFVSDLNTDSSTTDFLFDYIILQMDNAIANGLTDSDFVRLYELILKINKTKRIEKKINERINEKYLEHINRFMSLTTSNHEYLCNYAITQEKQGIKRLKETILNYITNAESKDEQGWKNWFNSVIRQLQDINSATKLRKTFIENKDKVDFSDLKLSSEQFTYMVDDKYINQLNSNLNSIDNTTKEYKELLWIIENKTNIAPDTYSTLFSQIKTQFEEFNNKPIEQISNLVDYINPLIEKVPNKKLEKCKSFSDLSSDIFSDRTIVSRNVYGERTQNPTNYIDEILSNDDTSTIDKIIKFSYNVYRTTNSIGIVVDVFEKLAKKHREKINPVFIKLIEEGFLITILKNTLIEDTNYENENTLQLIEYAFCRTHPQADPLSFDAAKEKIKNMLDYALDKDSEVVYNLISNLSKEEEYKKQIIDIIKSKSSKEINCLPKNLLDLAIESFNKDTWSEFKSNNEFLSIIAQKGNKEKNKYLLKILEDKIENNEEIDITLSLIDEIPTDKYNKTEKGFLIARLKEYLENESIQKSEDTIEHITKIIQTVQ